MSPRTRADMPFIMLVMLAALVFVLLTVHFARADSRLPFGVSCEQVKMYAGNMQIPDTAVGRARARVIGLTFGHWLTSAELRAAAACLRS